MLSRACPGLILGVKGTLFVKKFWFSPALLAVVTVVSVMLPARSVRAVEAVETRDESAIASDEKLNTLLYSDRQPLAETPTETTMATAEVVPEVAIAPSPVPITPLPAPTAGASVPKIATLLNAAAPADAPEAIAQVPPPPAPVEDEADAPDTDPEEEPRVLVAEVVVSGATGELEDAVYDAVSTRPGQTTSRSQLQQDVNAIFATGFFSRAEAVPSDTPLGVRITFVVQPNPPLQAVVVPGTQVVPQEVIDDIFGPSYGETVNFNRLQADLDDLMGWYSENGYALARVLNVPQVSDDGVVTLDIAEGVIQDIVVRFIDEQGEFFDEDGEPIEGRTREFIITREFETEPGDVFNEQQLEADLARAFRLGIFDEIRPSLDEAPNNEVILYVDVVEGQTGSIAAGVGISSASGLFGTVSYQERNLGGNNQRLSAEVQLGQRDLLFDVSFTDPWIATDPNRTSYTVNAFSRRSIPLVFQGGNDEVFLPNGDRPRVRRFGGGVTFGRPLDDGWRASAGFRYQNIRLQDSDGDLSPEDEFGNDLSFSGDGTDDLFLLQFRVSRDRRNSPLTPTSGTELQLSSEQSIPIGSGSIFLNRLRASYSYFIPVDFTDFTDEPGETLAFNVQGGVVLGDLPPYEAFSLGGTDSVRGYDAGDVGSGRAFLLGTVEYRFPIFSIIGGVLFLDVGTDLGTGSDVPGEPAVIRDKPGTGVGYGLGVRVQSPLGAIRIDYGFNDDGDGRLHFGIGERF